VRLLSRDGVSIELRPLAYQFDVRPAPKPGTDWDANWLVISDDVRTVEGLEWNFIDPCLTTWNTGMVSEWLRGTVDGTVQPTPAWPDEWAVDPPSDSPQDTLPSSAEGPFRSVSAPTPQLRPQCLRRRPRRRVLTETIKGHPRRTLTLLDLVSPGHDPHPPQETERHQTRGSQPTNWHACVVPGWCS